jgi:hypothetical protein
LISSLVLFVTAGFRIVSSIDWSDRRVPWDLSNPEPTERLGSIIISNIFIVYQEIFLLNTNQYEQFHHQLFEFHEYSFQGQLNNKSTLFLIDSYPKLTHFYFHLSRNHIDLQLMHMLLDSTHMRNKILCFFRYSK